VTENHVARVSRPIQLMTKSELPTSHSIDRLHLDAIRRQARLPVAASDARWTACAGPTTSLVVHQNGSVRACEGTSKDLGQGSLQNAWETEAFANLRTALANGTFPLDHCKSCVHWMGGEIVASAPPLRDYAAESPEDSSSPSHLIVRMPLADQVASDVLQELEQLLPRLDELVLDATTDRDFASAFATKVLTKLGATGEAPKLIVRMRGDDIAAVRKAVQGCNVARIECTLNNGEANVVAQVAALSAEVGATCTIRFVFTAENWFQFDAVTRACAAANTGLDLRLLDRDGSVPLEVIAADELTFLRDVVGTATSHMPAGDLPAAVTEAQTHLAHELRHTLRTRAQRELDASEELASTPLRLPPPEHAWCDAADPANPSNWWLRQLFSRAMLPSVSRWLLECVSSHRDLLSTQDGTWLRTLIQRLASDQHTTELLELLREVYGDAKQRKLLIAHDNEFAKRFELTRFGGPWAEELGLMHDRARKRPFAIKAATEPSDAPADITVLIPSFRHEIFIEETLRSVLAQRYGNFKVLVVDDCSPDDTVARARSIEDSRIDVRVNPENLGLGGSVLAALEHIDTPYVALLNSDDLFHPDRLSTCRDVLEQNDAVQLVTTGIQMVDQNGGQLTPANASLVLDGKKVFDWMQWFARVTPSDDLPQEDLFASLLECNFLITSSNLVARTDWLRAQADGLRSLKYCLDWQLFMQAALEGALQHVHEPLIAYRLHASNTVWFREGRRWSYYLEVNRVAAVALQRFLASDRLDATQKLDQVVDSVARHLATNTEMDGLALFLNCALDALQLDEAAANRPSVQKLIEGLNLRAEQQRKATQHYEDAPSSAGQQRQTLKLLLGTLAGEQAQLERSQKQWVQNYAESLERRITSADQQLDRLEAEKKGLYADQQKRIEDAKDLHSKVSEGNQAARQLRRERDDASARHDDVANRLEARKQDLEASAKKLAAHIAQAEADRLAHRTQTEADRLAHRTQTEADRLAHRQTETALRNEADKQIATVEQLEQRKARLLHEVANLKEEIDRLLKTREFRTGNFIWNKLPLAYMSRRGKKWYRRLKDAKQRTKMFFKRRRKANGTAVVAACWQWPIYSHTFVYQEMMSLKGTGLDVQLFHWDLGGTDQLHAAFNSLYENRTQIQPVRENHEKDKEHFEKTKPGKLRSFLERISSLSGKSVEELENTPIVLQGCTFARMAELANAKYIHSYFFYDQSFMAMQAAWLLDLPRGVSCYADHMMEDYPWKFVPLHIELCDVIVATSARIKSELSQLSGGKFDDKIVVKPNGVDGNRFPAKTRAARNPDEPFEVLSVSRIEPKKGLTHLVEAIAELNTRGHHVIAHIIGAKDEHSKGSLEYAAEFEACIKEHKLEDQVILHGMMKQEQMPPIIDKCRAFVAPYVETENGDKDGIPTAMLEALASSLPVITTNSGSIVEVIDDGVEGIVVAQHDSMAFANALEKVLSDNEVEQRMAKNARARFDKDFDIKVTEQRLHERIDGFLKAKR
jgi:glycosyltransferase involved in cell wall biosynthesis